MQTIDIRTTQNVTIEYEMAGLGERVLAQIIDLIVVGGVYLLFFLLFFTAMRGNWAEMDQRIYFFVLPFCFFVLYHFFFELLSHGQSLGKKALSIQVVRLDGEDPSPSDYLLRALLHFADLLGTVGILGALLIGSSPKRQRLGDMTAGTTVIKVKTSERFSLEDILRISSLEDYEPKYPAVRRFSEEDMLLIKNAIARYQRYPNKAHAQVIKALAHRLATLLEVPFPLHNETEFLKTLIRDYIVLTR